MLTGQILRYTTADVDVTAAVPTLYLLDLNNFGSTNWTKTNSIVTANSGTSPDGTNDAWQWQRSSTAAAYVLQAAARPAVADNFKFSVYAKPGTGNFLALYMSDSTGDPNAVRAVFNVSAGTITTAAHSGALTNISASIVAAANGFYRCSVQATMTADAQARCAFSGSSNGVEFDGTDSVGNTTILAFGATLETVGTYSSALFFDQTGNKAVGHWKTGLDVDTWQVYVMPVEFDPVTGTQFPIKIGNTPWLAAVAAGALTGAEVDIHRAYWPSWPQPWTSPLPAHADSTGTFVIADYFAGRVAAVDIMRNQAVISVNSWLDQFKLMMPRNLWQASCRWTLFDAGCRLSQAAFGTVGFTAHPGSTQSQIVMGAAGFPSGWFALGQLTFTSGLNAGFRRMVKSFDGVTFTLVAPFPFAVAVGDAYTAYPGCDKLLSTCTNKFNNAINFGGEDLIPKPETAV